MGEPTESSDIREPRAPRASLTLADFELIRRIGDGSFSQVLLARHKASSEEYALKVVDKQHVIRHNTVDQVRRERNLLDRMTDEGIVRLHFTFQDALSLYFGLEFCPGGELYDQIRAKEALDIDTTRFYTAEIVLILEALRKEGIVHRDLKPENLLLTATGHLKLIDFGSAKDLTADPDYVIKSRGSIDLRPRGGGRGGGASDTIKDNNNTINSSKEEGAEGSQPGSSTNAQQQQQSTEPTLRKPKRAVTLVGTADYVSPEVLNNDPVSYSTDLWALGCIIYQMLIGRPPFKTATEYLTFQKIIAGEYAPLPTSIPEDARDIVDSLLKLNPEERLGADDIEALKAHPFFSSVDWSTLRESPAPETIAVDTESIGSAASSFDWELQSMAAALPKIPSSGDIDLGVGITNTNTTNASGHMTGSNINRNMNNNKDVVYEDAYDDLDDDDPYLR